MEENQKLDQRRITIAPAAINAEGKIEPRKHVERIRVPALNPRACAALNHSFEPDFINSAPHPRPSLRAPATRCWKQHRQRLHFRPGTGKSPPYRQHQRWRWQSARRRLRSENIKIETMNVDQVPEDLVALQNYDAIILNNVPHGRTPTAGSGLSISTTPSSPAMSTILAAE